MAQSLQLTLLTSSVRSSEQIINKCDYIFFASETLLTDKMPFFSMPLKRGRMLTCPHHNLPICDKAFLHIVSYCWFTTSFFDSLGFYLKVSSSQIQMVNICRLSEMILCFTGLDLKHGCCTTYLDSFRKTVLGREISPKIIPIVLNRQSCKLNISSAVMGPYILFPGMLAEVYWHKTIA